MRRGVIAALLVVLAGLAVLVAPGVRPAPLAAPTLTGRIAYASGGNIWIWRNGAHQFTNSGHDGSPDLTPDGQRLTYVRYDDSFSDVLVQATAGGDAQFLTNNRPVAETGSLEYVQQALWALNPAWAPDGSRIAWASDRGTDAPVLWIMTATGDNQHSLQTSPPNPPVERLHWSPDGSAIVATSQGSGKDEIWSLDLDSGVWKEVAAPTDGAYDPAWSPDGTRVAYAARTGRQTDIWVVPVDGSAPPAQLTQMGRARAPVFSPDGKQIAFLAEKDDRFQMFVIDMREENGTLRAGSPQQVTSQDAGLDAPSGLSWSR